MMKYFDLYKIKHHTVNIYFNEYPDGTITYANMHTPTQSPYHAEFNFDEKELDIKLTKQGYYSLTYTTVKDNKEVTWVKAKEEL